MEPGNEVNYGNENMEDVVAANFAVAAKSLRQQELATANIDEYDGANDHDTTTYADVLEFLKDGELFPVSDYFSGGTGVPYKKQSDARMREECSLLRRNFHENSSPMFLYLATVVYIKLSQHISQRNITMMLKVTGKLVKDIMRIVRPSMVKGVGAEEANAILES
eukprot:Nk52_evm1s1407 gene=Nk52_evmTU1s1407